MSRSRGSKICGSQQTVILLRNKTAVHTFLPSFNNRNDLLCQERLLRSRNFSTMAMWRHTSPLHRKLKQPQRLRQRERSWQIVFAPFHRLQFVQCCILRYCIQAQWKKQNESSYAFIKRSIDIWRFNRAVACSTDEFCSASDEINAGSTSWMLKLTEG